MFRNALQTGLVSTEAQWLGNLEYKRRGWVAVPANNLWFSCEYQTIFDSLVFVLNLIFLSQLLLILLFPRLQWWNWGSNVLWLKYWFHIFLWFNSGHPSKSMDQLSCQLRINYLFSIRKLIRDFLHTGGSVSILWFPLIITRKLYLPEDGCQNITPTSKGRASTAISLGLHSYYAFPLLELPDQRCLGVFEIVSTKPSLRLPNLIKVFASFFYL